MTIQYKLLSIILATLLVFGAGFALGVLQTQTDYKVDNAVRTALLKFETDRNLKVGQDLTKQYGKDVEYAKSKAGRAALARWLDDHGLLPDGSKVSGDGDQAPVDCPEVPHGSSEEQSTGGRIEEFAADCADDASRLMDWQVLCQVQGCIVE